MRIRGLLAAACLAPTPALAQALNYTTFGNPGSLVTTVTGIRGNGMTGDFTTGTGGSTAGVFYTLPSLTPAPYPNASAPPVNFTGATTNTPYGPSFGSPTGILRGVGSYKTTANGSGDLGYLFDGANAPGQQLTTLIGGPDAFNTIAHSNFGNQVVGNWDTRQRQRGQCLPLQHRDRVDDDHQPAGPLHQHDRLRRLRRPYRRRLEPRAGPVTRLHPEPDTGVYTDYDAPGTGTVVTHFEGITGGGRANTYNLVADSVDSTGAHGWVVHIDANGNATWTELSVLPGNSSSTTSANSIYGSTAIGVYTLNGVTYAFTTTVPGIYNPITNNATLSSGTAGATLIAGIQGDDIVNNGTVTTTGAGSVGLNINTYGVATNNGTVNASGAGSSGVLMSGSFSSLLNYGTINAAPGTFAIQTDSTAVGSLVYNTGVINGAVSIAAGPYARFENSGWMGITAPGAGVTHAISGTFAQTSLGTLALRVGSNGVSDQLMVNGQARLAGTALAVFQPGITFAKSYTLVSATNGLTGTFGTLATQNLPGFLSGSLGYSPTNVTLNLQASLARLSGLGDHQRSVGRALDTAFNAGSGLGAMPALFSLTADQIPYALTVLSGSNASVGLSTDMLAGSQFTSLMTSRSLTRHADQQTAELAACDQVTACQVGAYEAPPNWSAWATAFGGGQWLNAEPTSGAPAAQQSIGGGAFGGDFRAGPQTVLGAAAGVSVSNYGVSYTGANGRATGAHFGVYGLYDMGTFYANGSLAYNRFDGSATRVIAGIGSTETAKSSAVSSQLAGRLEVGRPFEVAKFETGQMGVTPFVAVQPSQLWTPAYTEWSVTQNGAPGVFALSYQAQGTTSLPTFLGAQLDGETMVNARPLKAWLRAAWVHEFLPDRGVTAGFTVLPGSTFSVDGARAASNAARLELGVKYAVGNQTSLFANSNAELSDRGQSVGATVGLRIVW